MTLSLCRSLCLILLLMPSVAGAQDQDAARRGTGLPLPRFASLNVTEANLRTGPGTRYPIDWVFKHQGMPVEILAEYDIWRRVRDVDGAEGWVHKMALTGKRAAIVIGTPQDLHRRDTAESATLAHLEVGAIGQITSCGKEWCRLKFDGIKGYLPKTAFWGVYPHEVFD